MQQSVIIQGMEKKKPNDIAIITNIDYQNKNEIVTEIFRRKK